MSHVQKEAGKKKARRRKKQARRRQDGPEESDSTKKSASRRKGYRPWVRPGVRAREADREPEDHMRKQGIREEKSISRH